MDSRVALLAGGAYRHAKPIAVLPGAEAVLAGADPAAAGVIAGDDAGELVAALTGLLVSHRVWERFPPARS
ncbi:hypothetical protein GCM10018781_80030 [Kitasatospora indigofera]|uniref:Large catalase C-terminal domain-containing protein n=1 Tax=Kitasatospora indigofera TaxID=67307 RepID=A0A918YW84_9ACTN|nr:hypothetical protein [Kitasatospora indigofera]GHE27422.1 hypothetical protein GCM10018781_80030 [Kitasatospora indigofera]